MEFYITLRDSYVTIIPAEFFLDLETPSLATAHIFQQLVLLPTLPFVPPPHITTLTTEVGGLRLQVAM